MTANHVMTKGSLSLVVQLTDIMAKKPAPWKSDDFLTKSGGQVAGLGGGNLKRILGKHGITRILTQEGGRTSRGNMGLMKEYVGFMNALNDQIEVDLSAVEEFWADRVGDYFRNQPFTLPADDAKTVAANLDELFGQARKRQSENRGTQYLGTILQHLVAAKLSLVLPEGVLEVHGASVADGPTERSGDFIVNDTVIHCTTAPGEPLIRKCEANLKAGARPVIITVFERVRTALDLAVDAGLAGRVEVWDLQQFLSTNIHELGHFEPASRRAKLMEIIDKYNEIVEDVETDPSLRIELEAK
ncbi:MAG: DUF4928 family protein [Propionibacteriaceae bacterium]|nr:DUF4928 family protein [Propionibacteriaceae bacterium]